ncbi:MAG: hemolysin III family protein [Bacteroidaceae bacterium]
MKRVFYTKREEQFNAWSHFGGIILGIVAGTLLLIQAWKLEGCLPFWSVILYVFGMLSSYFSSTFYHRTRFHSKWRTRLRHIDHAAIYWHIAGSYSPILLIGLRNSGVWGWALFLFIWIFAFIGTIASFRKMEKHSNIETACFLIMGLTLVCALKPILEMIDPIVLYWVFGEGVCFIVGAAFYSFHSLRYMHSVFHFFVLGGSICHIIALWFLLR